jgi:hypothetical protein
MALYEVTTAESPSATTVTPVLVVADSERGAFRTIARALPEGHVVRSVAEVDPARRAELAALADEYYPRGD